MMEAASPFFFPLIEQNPKYACEKNQARMTVEEKQIPLIGYDM